MPARAKRRVDITILDHWRDAPSRYWLRKVVRRALDHVPTEESCQIGLVLADDDTVKRLNKEYRGLDEVTDVLSFSPVHHGRWQGEGEPPEIFDYDVSFVLPPGEPLHLGEVIISYPQAVRQALAAQSSLENELAQLVVHGVMHLAGFDHEEPLERSRMGMKEREILSWISS